MYYCCICGRKANHATKSYHFRGGEDTWYHYCHWHGWIGERLANKLTKKLEENEMATTVHQVGGYGRLGISVYTGNPELFEAIEELVKEYARQGEEVWFGGEPYKVEEESCTNPISHNYKAEFDRLVNAVHKLKNAMLGENYYVVDSCGEPLASEIIIDEIINKEKRNSSALKRWWQNHSNYK